MPRIDPIQLLKCLSVLLSPNGGIKSKDEVQRLASLMTKFSKKLVSKCIYIQILKCTETELLGLFMGSGGWRLAHVWLTESIVAKNWPLVQELLELLLLCPVDIERLKTNNCPKLVKELSKDGSQAAIRVLATKLVEQWLKTVKGESVTPVMVCDIPKIVCEAANLPNGDVTVKEEVSLDSDKDNDIKNIVVNEEMNIADSEKTSNSDKAVVKASEVKSESAKELETERENETLPVLKISLKDGKQVISKVEDPKQTEKDKDNKSSDKEREHKTNEKSRSRDKDRSKSSSKHSSSSRSHSSSKSSSDKHKSSSSKSSSSSSSSSKHKSRDKSSDKPRNSSSSKHKESADKKSHDKTKSSSSDKKRTHKTDTSKEDKSHKNSRDSQVMAASKEQNDKNKETLEKLQPPSIHKLGKIPKLAESAKKDTPSISIEVRNPNDPNRPKTVKMFRSKFRSHGLEEEARPPPPRGSVVKKPPPAIPPTVCIPKRQSPSHGAEAPPEKKSKPMELVEKPGSIKLIPPKPKPVLLLESDMFMSALNASATNKKEPRKRKRRTSGSKDGNSATESSPPHTPTTIATASPTRETKSTPLRFYQDTLDTEEDKDKEKAIAKESENNEDIKGKSPNQESSDSKDTDSKDAEEKLEEVEHVKTTNGLRGVLCYHKKKGTKKSIRWRPDPELEEIQYFELDETERVNVTKTFMDMKHLERVHERESFQKARNLINDVMEEKTNWRPLIPIDAHLQTPVEYGKNSKEKDIQAARQKSILQSLYFHKSMIPDSPSEPDNETHTHNDPNIIPLEDVTGNQDNVSDFRNTPWPEPKGNMPASSMSSLNTSHVFPPPIAQFPPAFPNGQFGMPGFQGPGPGMVPGNEWQNSMPPNLLGPGGMPPGSLPPGPLGPGPMPPGVMPAPNMPPGLMMPPDSMMMTPDMFGGPAQMFPGPMPPENFNMMDNMNGMPNMFGQGYPMNVQGGHQGPPGPDNHPGSFSFGNRGGMRGRGSGNQWRGKGNWDGPIRGRGGHSRGGRKTAVCIHFQKRGSCRQGDKCAFLHPGVNCPY